MAYLRPILRSGPGMWAPSQNIQEITASQKPEASRLAFDKQRFNEILNLYKNAFGGYGQNPSANIPRYFNEAINLYQPGGQYGAGTERAIQKGMGQEISAGNIASAMTGMGSSTTSLARTSGAIGRARDARMLAEEERLRLLGGTLGEAGRAGLETQRIEAMRQEALLRSLANLG